MRRRNAETLICFFGDFKRDAVVARKMGGGFVHWVRSPSNFRLNTAVIACTQLSVNIQLTELTI